jgi:small subunit ribosomal protein S16
VAVKIRLKRLGKVRVPQYRIVVVDSRKKRDGRVLEEIGKYHPKEEPSYIDVTSDRAQYWLGVGAQPTEAVEAILKITGDWQTFKGLPGTEGTLRVAEAKRDKLEIFNEALAEAHSSAKAEAVTKKASPKKADAAKADKVEDKPAVEAKPARAEKAEKPAEEAKAEETPAEAPAEAAAEETPAVVPASETPEGAADEAEAAETVTAEDAGKSEA